ncbi:BPTI/Kunitz domain-containing protein-like [Dermacentor andersoni]|uniref:BPTI/Kunitz domain-containing protein-like n=1 Tax=Dermacentor andersoni TaxID=34620 RepID=UPI003B3B537A
MALVVLKPQGADARSMNDGVVEFHGVVPFATLQRNTDTFDTDAPICKGTLELTACDNETERYFFHHEPDKQVCLVRWQLDPGCLGGKNRFTSATECRKRCVADPSGKYEEPACRVPRFQAACPLSEKRFTHYYDRSVSACASWRTACLGGPNRHESLAACVQTCKRNFFDKLLLGL